MKGKELELKKLIIKGLLYIEFPQSMDSKDIDVNLVIEIRKYIFDKTNSWYKEKFENAYNFDVGLSRKSGDGYYSDDGIAYTFDDDMNLVDCILYGDEKKERFKFTHEYKFSFHFHKGKYYYINEIDHFFTYCINKYLLKKPFSEEKIKDKGMIAIKDKICKNDSDFA